MLTLAIITAEELEAELTAIGVDYSKYEENLEQLLSSTIQRLQGLTGLSITPMEREMLIFQYHSSLLELDFYPVCVINQLCINENIIPEEQYVLDGNLGVLYFKSTQRGLLKVKYTTFVPDDVITNTINPLLVDMLAYDIGKGFSSDGVYTTIKEGDDSVSIDAKTGLYASIQDRINKLSSMYRCRAKLL